MEEKTTAQVQNEAEARPKRSKGKVAASYLAKIAIFTAISYVLRLLRFKISIAFPVWLELHFADLPALIGGFALGPVAGVAITVISTLIKMLTQGSETGFVGDLANIMTGIALVLPAALIYKYKKNKKGALWGVLVGSICSIAVSVPVNRYILVPFYESIFTFDAILGMFRVLFENATKENFYTLYLCFSVVPFNLLRCLVVGLATFLVYKRISHLLNKF